jgi:hypothetical protein
MSGWYTDRKEKVLFIVCATISFGAMFYDLACTPAQVAGARDALAIQSAACCVVKARAGSTPEQIREACAVSDAVTPLVDAILAETQARETGARP